MSFAHLGSHYSADVSLLLIYVNPAISLKDEICFLCVYHLILTALYETDRNVTGPQPVWIW
jgi:hypothetical protein